MKVSPQNSILELVPTFVVGWLIVQVATAVGADVSLGTSPLVEATQLRQTLESEDRTGVILLDARSKAQYEKGHLPSALWVDADAWRQLSFEPQGLSNVSAWSAKLGALGIKSDSTVVVYGDALPNTARIWWLLRYAGIKKAAVLDGGNKAWEAIAGQVTTDVAKPKPTDPEIDFDRSLLAELDDVVATRGECAVIDARSASEFSGARGIGSRVGHIPSATHLDWTEFVDDKGKLLKKEEIVKLLESKGCSIDSPMITHCQTGGRSSVVALALEAAGSKQIRNYYKGWSEYAGALTQPVEK